MAEVTPATVQRWLDAYAEAWRTYDATAIRGLFAPDARYAYHPYDEPLVGREAIVASWLAERDAPGSWEGDYRPLMIDGARAIATGETRYTRGTVFSNLWELEFDDELRCTKFVEWFMEHPD